MKIKNISAVSLSAIFAASCAQQPGQDDYDVSNPYSAPEYVDENGSPYESVNLEPTYDVPAVYEDTATPVPAAGSTTTVSPVIHTVVSGDSLWAISKKYGVPIASIKSANSMTSDVVVLGTKLQIPSQ